MPITVVEYRAGFRGLIPEIFGRDAERVRESFAVGVENDKGKIKWTIVAPKRIDDSRNVAIYELSALPSGFLHVTTKAPDAK